MVEAIKKRLKVVKKKMIKYEISLDYYTFSLFHGTEYYRRMNLIRSQKHERFSEEVNKLALSSHHDNCDVLDGVSTRPWGTES